MIASPYRRVSAQLLILSEFEPHISISIRRICLLAEFATSAVTKRVSSSGAIGTTTSVHGLACAQITLQDLQHVPRLE